MGPPVRPVADVMALTEAYAAAGEATAAVSVLQRSAECGRDRPCAGTDLQQLAVGVVAHDHPAGVAGQALGRSSWNAYAVFEDRLTRRLGIRQHRGVHVDHHLITLAGRARIDSVVERGLGEEGQRVGLLLRERRRLHGNLQIVGCIRGRAGYLSPRLLIHGLARCGQGLHEQRAHLRRQPAPDGDRAVLVLIDVQRAAGMLTMSLAGLGLVVHPPPAAHDALHVLRRARTADRHEAIFRLRRGHAGQLADLRVGELAAGERLRESRQRAERAGHADVFTRSTGREAHTPGEPGRAGPEAAVPSAAGVERSNEVEQARGGGVEMRAQLGDLVAETVEVGNGLQVGQRAGRQRVGGRDVRWRLREWRRRGCRCSWSVPFAERTLSRDFEGTCEALRGGLRCDSDFGGQRG